MRVLRKFYKVKGSWNLYDWSIRMTYMVTEKAKWRAKVVTFFDKYGLEATEEAFSVKKSSIYKWKKLFDPMNLCLLEDRSRVPKNVRQ